MYINYGDRNFFDTGILVDTEHSDTEFPMILCRPYDDEENLYQFNEVTVDITGEWIDRASVMSFIGMTEETFDPVQFAIGCTSYYSWDNFGQPYHYDWQRADRELIEGILNNRQIASDNLDMEWKESPGFECIDLDTLQYVKKTGEQCYQLVQFDETPEGHGIVREEEIDVKALDMDEIFDTFVAPYGYESIGQIAEEYGDDAWPQIVAECVFENHGQDESDSWHEANSFEDAEKQIKAFIWERKGSLY